MGCGSSVASENVTSIQPVPNKEPISVVNQKAVQDSEHSKQENNKTNYTTDEKGREDVYVDIKIANPEAFNDLFVKQRQQAIDNGSYRSIIESWCPNSLQELVETLKIFSKEKSTIDCYWIIFYWIARHIEFDVVSYFRKIYDDQTAESVFQSKKGVGTGYTNLYKYLCNQLELPCEIVTGYSKNYGFDNHDNASFDTDHVWNAVQIDHYWYLIEPTWGAGFITDQKIFKSKLISYYFCPRPNEMIYHHRPNDPKWQLLQKSIEMTQYLLMPKMYPSFFELNLELISPDHYAHVNLVPNQSYALVLLRAPFDVHLTADLQLHNHKIENSNRIVFDNEKQLYRCYFAPISFGNHKIIIYGKQNNTEFGKYNAVVGLTLDVKEIPQNIISFPKIWKTFTDLGLDVIYPQNTHLIKVANGIRDAEIQIRTPHDVLLRGHLENENGEKVPDSNIIYYDIHQHFWRCKFAPNSDGIFEALITAKKKSDIADYTPVVSFRIEAEQIPIPPLSYPKTSQLFYNLDIKVIAPKDQAKIILSNNENEAEIHIQTPDNVELLGHLINSNQEIVKGGHQIFYDRHKKFWRCKFAPNENGMFDAEITAKKKSDTHNFHSVISFKIEAKQVPISHLSYPYTWQLFHDFDLKIITPKDLSNAIWPAHASFAEIRLKAPNDVQLSCYIEYNDIKIENGTLTQFDNNKQEWQLLFAPQQTGLHKLNIYAERQSETKILSGAVAQFDLYVTELQNPITFPVTYPEFQFNKCQIYEPLSGILQKGTLVPIHCVIPGATEVDLKVDSQWMNTKDYHDSVLKTAITVGSNDVIIYTKYGQKQNYDGLIQYSVQ